METDSPLRHPSISKLLCELIKEADPGTLPKAPDDVRKTAAGKEVYNPPKLYSEPGLHPTLP